MDGATFDTLVKRLTRRSAVRMLSGGALASLGMSALAGNDRRNKHVQRRCLPAPKSCLVKPKKKDDRRRCQRCCQTYRPVSASKGVCCQPIGYGCRSTAECCLGICTVGLCQNEVVQLPPVPCRGLLAPCTTADVCCPVVKVGDTCPNPNLQCAPIQLQKGPQACGTPGVAVCCSPSCGFCSNDCECCGDLRCQNGICGPPPPCHQLGEACTDGEPCCAGAGTCNGAICCLADGASCPCGEPGNCQGCCSGICGPDGRCGSGSPPCAARGQACVDRPCCITLGEDSIPPMHCRGLHLARCRIDRCGQGGTLAPHVDSFGDGDRWGFPSDGRGGSPSRITGGGPAWTLDSLTS